MCASRSCSEKRSQARRLRHLKKSTICRTPPKRFSQHVVMYLTLSGAISLYKVTFSYVMSRSCYFRISAGFKIRYAQLMMIPTVNTVNSRMVIQTPIGAFGNRPNEYPNLSVCTVEANWGLTFSIDTDGWSKKWMLIEPLTSFPKPETANRCCCGWPFRFAVVRLPDSVSVTTPVIVDWA